MDYGFTKNEKYQDLAKGSYKDNNEYLVLQNLKEGQSEQVENFLNENEIEHKKFKSSEELYGWDNAIHQLAQFGSLSGFDDNKLETFINENEEKYANHLAYQLKNDPTREVELFSYYAMKNINNISDDTYLIDCPECYQAFNKSEFYEAKNKCPHCGAVIQPNTRINF